MEKAVCFSYTQPPPLNWMRMMNEHRALELDQDDHAQNEQCPICSSKLIKTKTIEGYLEGAYYNLFDCSGCGAATASPREPDPQVYNLIYKNADDIQGYWRYSKFASQVLEESNPLGYLAAQEEMYWAVSEFLQASTPKDKKLKVLEIGSGLGYLTYSMSQAGYDVTGLDISSEAVDQATTRYGNLFHCVSVEDFSRDAKGTFDLVVTTEVIEHVKNPLSLLMAGFDLLKPGGGMLVTTPNRDYYKGKRHWGSDLPPVHLWWFSEDSMRVMGDHIGSTVQFSRYRGLNRRMPQNPFLRWTEASCPDKPIINKDGMPTHPMSQRRAINGKSLFARVVPWRIQVVWMQALNVAFNPLGRRKSMATIFLKP
jgi:SAM-dependent methyltransferase